MSFDRTQFRNLIERVLEEHGLHSEAAVRLLLGTAATESRFGTYLRQMHGGPAVGIFQMEPGTFYWLKECYGIRFRHILPRTAEEMEWDLRLAILMARLRYYVVPAPLPEPENIMALAQYWKRNYNTPQGRGTIQDFIRNYTQFVEES